ncbi:tRNA (adenine-N(1)-)-methyltransferase catalytic subunit trm61 [Paraconiothyrium brasiliense]|uniref:tRNA (adenine(58)-N(1))-methyltransferase catalytic subunit TRM61 n=1 Tax=Paraconiothyrium brasiliense TaxID=300254 RepID=A0ABR3QNN0_9PLEO
MAPTVSPFLDPGPYSSAHTLGILQLKRDHLIPIVLSDSSSTEYAEGNVVNTRFGSFTHSSLIDKPWGTQVLASVVDTGSRGGRSKKRKREATGDGNAAQEAVIKSEEPAKAVVRATTASSGFAHLVPPTPETWTLCLPHRTQVVYTPDYSFIIQKTRLRPGDHIIEAGAGSGSFTHAVARTVFNGYPGLEQPEEEEDQQVNGTNLRKRRRRQKRHGHVYSFEYHKPRAEQLREEITSHGLDPLVTITNRDVYEDGFCLDDENAPNADVIFLDLPAPWLALKHLTRSPPPPAVVRSVASDPSTPTTEHSTSTPQPPSSTKPFCSPLNPKSTTRICTFSPCIEQVQKTVAAMRSYGWLDIEMFTLEHKRLEVRRERVGLAEEGLRGANPSPATVQEAVQRLRDVEDRAKVFHGLQKEKQEQVMRRAEAKKRGQQVPAAGEESEDKKKIKTEGLPPSKHDRLERAKKCSESRPLFKEGRLVCRTEPEIKTHTSYLVFAMLPVEWTAEDEEKARRKWG